MGKFIVFEGADGCGKSTHIKLLQEYFAKHPQKKVIFTREPGGFGIKLPEKIREILLDEKSEICPEAEAYLYAASRAQHVKKIKEKLAEGYTVICDRYYYSSLVYQGIGRGLGMGEVQTLNDMALQDLYPDAIYYLKVDYDTYLNRKMKRTEHDRIEAEDSEFFKKILKGYDELFGKLGNVITISTANSGIKTVNDKLMKHFMKI